VARVKTAETSTSSLFSTFSLVTSERKEPFISFNPWEESRKSVMKAYEMKWNRWAVSWVSILVKSQRSLLYWNNAYTTIETWKKNAADWWVKAKGEGQIKQLFCEFFSSFKLSGEFEGCSNKIQYFSQTNCAVVLYGSVYTENLSISSK